jgi:CBS domain-containing protein
MSLKTILAAKGDNIVCIESTADLAAAAKLLSTHRIGALVVLDAGGRLVGILSERDIVRTMADVGNAVLQLPVAQVMTRNVLASPIHQSARFLIEAVAGDAHCHRRRSDRISEQSALHLLHLLTAASGTNRRFNDVRPTSARGGKAEMLRTAPIRRS